MENLYRNFAGFDISLNEVVDLCRDAWRDGDYDYLFIDRSEKKGESNHSIRNRKNPG